MQGEAQARSGTPQDSSSNGKRVPINGVTSYPDQAASLGGVEPPDRGALQSAANGLMGMRDVHFAGQQPDGPLGTVNAAQLYSLQLQQHQQLLALSLMQGAGTPGLEAHQLALHALPGGALHGQQPAGAGQESGVSQQPPDGGLHRGFQFADPAANAALFGGVHPALLAGLLPSLAPSAAPQPGVGPVSGLDALLQSDLALGLAAASAAPALRRNGELATGKAFSAPDLRARALAREDGGKGDQPSAFSRPTAADGAPAVASLPSAFTQATKLQDARSAPSADPPKAAAGSPCVSPFQPPSSVAYSLESGTQSQWLSPLQSEQSGFKRRSSFPRYRPSGLGTSMLRHCSVGAPPDCPPHSHVAAPSRLNPGLRQASSFSPVPPSLPPADPGGALMRSAAQPAQEGPARSPLSNGLGAPPGAFSSANEAAAAVPDASDPASSPGVPANAAAPSPPTSTSMRPAEESDARGFASPQGSAPGAASSAPPLSPPPPAFEPPNADEQAPLGSGAGQQEHPSSSFGLGGAWSKSMDLSEVLRSVREGSNSRDGARSRVRAVMPVSKDWEAEVCEGAPDGAPTSTPPTSDFEPTSAPAVSGDNRGFKQLASAAPPMSASAPDRLGGRHGSTREARSSADFDASIPPKKRIRHDARAATAKSASGAQPPLGRDRAAPVLPAVSAAGGITGPPLAPPGWTVPGQIPAPEQCRPASDDARLLASLLSTDVAERTQAAAIVLSDPVKYARHVVTAAQCLSAATPAAVPLGPPLGPAALLGPQMPVPPFSSLAMAPNMGAPLNLGAPTTFGLLPEAAEQARDLSGTATNGLATSGTDSGRSAPMDASPPPDVTLKSLVSMQNTLSNMYEYFTAQKMFHMKELHRLIASAGDNPADGTCTPEDENAALRAILRSADIMRAIPDGSLDNAVAPPGSDALASGLAALNGIPGLGAPPGAHLGGGLPLSLPPVGELPAPRGAPVARHSLTYQQAALAAQLPPGSLDPRSFASLMGPPLTSSAGLDEVLAAAANAARAPGAPGAPAPPGLLRPGTPQPAAPGEHAPQRRRADAGPSGPGTGAGSAQVDAPAARRQDA